MDFEITRAIPEDAEELLAYLKIVGGETDNLSFGAEGLSVSLEEEREYIKKLMNSANSVMYLAKRNGKIIGDAVFRGFARERLRHRGELGISIVKAEWGKGIGSLLLEKIIEFARLTSHVEIISLEVRSDNIRAIRLYKKYGFEKIGEFKGFFKINGADIDYDLMNLYLI